MNDLVVIDDEQKDRADFEYEHYMDQVLSDDSDSVSDTIETIEEKGVKSFFYAFRLAFRGNLESKIIVILYIAVIIRCIFDLICFAKGVLSVKFNSVPNNFIYYLISMLLPFGVWIYSTRQKLTSFNYKITKMMGITIAVLSLGISMLNVLFICMCMFIVPLVLKIPVSADVTADMIVSLARLFTLLAPVIVSVVSTKSLLVIIFKKETAEMIYKFKIDRNIDTRRNKDTAFDYTAAKDVKTGKMYPVTEDTRRYHMAIVGPTGTGKTSMALTVAIAKDLDQRIRNENKQKKEIERMLKDGSIVLTKDIKDSDFDRKWFRAKGEKEKKKLNEVFDNYPLCGVTIVAPNAGFGDEVFELAKNRKIKKIYRVDPTLKNGHHKEGFIGFNPIYINPELNEFDKRLEIISKSRMFADVLQLLFDSAGSSDVYFSGLNKQITSSLCALIIKGYPILHEKFPDKYPREQACPQQFVDVIADFVLATDYVEVMEDYIRNHREERYDYENKIKTIKRDLLGDGAKTMKEQIRGLYNIASDIIANPLVRDVLCAEKTMIIDKALSENYITIVNYELSLGDSDSKAFGEFFLLSLQNAVFKRPKSNRPFHMLYIDEFPVLLHPSMEKIFSLYRQYNVCAAVALQSLAQFDRQQNTKFMKNVVLGNARTQIFFGGLGPEEMEYFNKIGGKDYIVQEQNTVSESALSLAETNLSYSSRTSVTKDDVHDAREFRNKDFQNATLITVRKGNVQDGVAVSFSFITNEQKKGLQPYRVEWSKYYEEEFADGTEVIRGRDGRAPAIGKIGQQVQTSMEAMVSTSNTGYEIQNKELLNPELSVNGIEISQEAAVLNTQTSVRESINKLKADMSIGGGLSVKEADVKVTSNETAKEKQKKEVVGSHFELEFELGDIRMDDVKSEIEVMETKPEKNETHEDTSSVNMEIDFDSLMKKIDG